MATEKKYPFKFLDAYSREDQDIFFGRDEEIEALYQMVYQTDLILIYGASGTGKTSLIQCGLAGKFQPYEWLGVEIRRGENINESLEKKISEFDNVKKKAPTGKTLSWLNRSNAEPASQETAIPPIIRELKNLYLQHFKPVFLIFDQFEELYILGTKQEQRRFVETVGEILRIEQPVKIIISIREEYLGYLYEFEKKVPELLRKKLRIEPMNLEKVQTVVKNIGQLPQSNVRLRTGEEDAIGTGIFEKLKTRENTRTIDLPYLQVFLDKLYIQITGDMNREADAEFTLAELEETGNIGDVLRDFLDEQVQKNAVLLDTTPEVVKKLLAPFVTIDGTKDPLSADMLHDRLPDLPKSLIDKSLQAFQNSRILRFDEKEQRYEVAHDSLARQIATYQDAEDVALQISAQVIRTQMLLDVEKREVFTERQLLLIEPYLGKIHPSGEVWDWIEKSRLHWHVENESRLEREREEFKKAMQSAQIERTLRMQAEVAQMDAEMLKSVAEKNEKRAINNAKQARQRTRVALLFSILAVLLTVFSIRSYYQTEEARQEAQKQVDAFKAEEQRRKAAEAINQQIHIDNLKVKIQRFIEGGTFDLANDSLQILKNINPNDPDISKFKSKIK